MDRAPLTEEQCAERLAFTQWDRHRIATKVLNGFVKKPPFTNQLYHQELIEKLEEELDDLRISGKPKAPQTIVAQYREAIHDNESDVWLRFNYAAFLLSTRDFKAAEEQVRVFLDFLPENPPALGNLGAALLSQ